VIRTAAPQARPTRLNGRLLRGAVAFAVSALTVVGIMSPAPAQAAFVGKNDWIAFSALSAAACDSS